MKHFLVFYDDEVDSSREAANVYYSWLVMASSEEEAIQKFCDSNPAERDVSSYAAMEMDIIE